MNDDDRLQHYFTARSVEIAVPSAGLAAITRRGRRRRHRRTAVTFGGVAAVLALGGAAISQRGGGGGGQDVTSYGSSVVASPLQWTLVTPKAGIGSSVTSATTDDGTVYGLSTAPGSSGGDPFQGPQHLYRSTDGTEWSAVDLPDDLWAADVAAAGDRLYAVGTSPAGGGGEQVRLASSTDGGAAWADGELPLDLGALGAGFPGKVGIRSTHVATGGDTTVVAVALGGTLDPADVVHDLGGRGASVVRGGIDLYPAVCSSPPVAPEGQDPTTTVVDGQTSTTMSEADAIAAKERSEKESKAGRAGGAATDPAWEAKCSGGPGGGPTVEQHRTWADLGISPAAGRLAEGRTVMFAATGDQPFTAAGELPDGIDSLELFGSTDGFWAVYEDWNGSSTTTHASSSADGRTWVASPAALAGAPIAVGELAGRPTVALRTDGPDGTSLTLQELRVDGAGGPVDVSASLGEARLDSYVSAADFGPLGFAATVVHNPSGDVQEQFLVHSADGAAFSVVPIPTADAGHTRSAPAVDVSADAITVRLFDRDPSRDQAAGEAVPPTPRLFVGTPG